MGKSTNYVDALLAVDESLGGPVVDTGEFALARVKLLEDVVRRLAVHIDELRPESGTADN